MSTYQNEAEAMDAWHREQGYIRAYRVHRAALDAKEGTYRAHRAALDAKEGTLAALNAAGEGISMERRNELQVMVQETKGRVEE